ncbi:hypothetical protein ACT7DL_31310 [Bacillus paranthracis]
MHENARGYVQDSFQSLQEAKQCLEAALQTVEKDFNRARIEHLFMRSNKLFNVAITPFTFRTRLKKLPIIRWEVFSKWHTS